MCIARTRCAENHNARLQITMFVAKGAGKVHAATVQAQCRDVLRGGHRLDNHVYDPSRRAVGGEEDALAHASFKFVADEKALRLGGGHIQAYTGRKYYEDDGSVRENALLDPQRVRLWCLLSKSSRKNCRRAE